MRREEAARRDVSMTRRRSCDDASSVLVGSVQKRNFTCIYLYAQSKRDNTQNGNGFENLDNFASSKPITCVQEEMQLKSILKPAKIEKDSPSFKFVVGFIKFCI